MADNTDYKKKLIKKIETFYVEVIEEFKEAELKIMMDSKFRNIFKKKDYDGNIKVLRQCKKRCIDTLVSDIVIPADDTVSKDVLRYFERCMMLFTSLCDSYIQLQEALKRKANKEDLKFSEYKEVFNKVQDTREKLNNNLHDLDIVYSDYSFDENADPYEFLD